MKKWFKRPKRSPARTEPAVSAPASTSATTTSSGKTFPSGIKLLHDPEHSVVDLILVHGLTGDREKTWTATNAAVPWPKSLLPLRVPNARVLTFGYDAYVADWRGMVSKNRIGNHSMNLLTAVAGYREDDDTNNRPIIFICHSLGGLVCQDALSVARQRPERHLQNIFVNTRGILFLGTPHHGAGLAKCAEMLANLIGLVKQTNPQILRVLESESEVLARVQDGFHTMVRSRSQSGLQPIEITCFYEELPLPGIGVVVPSHSAILPGYIPIGIRGNHIDMTKFEHLDDPGFVQITGELRRWMKAISNASEPGTKMLDLTGQVGQEHRTERTNAHGNVHWIVPRALNHLFTGRAELLLRMQKALLNDRTSTGKQKRFVITGLGGQGKSEVCLKFASLTQEEFWGIFWVDVNTPLTAKSGFITIAEGLGRSIESIPEALQILANTKQSWLLILDNADDPNFDYQNYLPSGTKGTIIITSRLTECRQYSPENAEALKGLEDQDSKELLFRAADIPRDSWLSYDSQAEEVVRLLGSHTLALIQAGVYVRQNHCQLDQYPVIYRRQRKRLLKYRPKQAQSRYCDVYTTFEASAEVLMKSQNEDAKDALHLLEILSMLNASILPLQIIQDAWEGCRKVLNISDLEMSNIDDMSRSHLSRLPSFMEAESNEWDPYRLTEAISLLASLSLVTRHDLGGLPGLSMHALAHAWAKDRQHSEQQDVAWITAGCVLAFSCFNANTWQTEERRLTPHVLSYLDIEIGRIFSYGIKATISIIPILLKCGWILLFMRQDSKLSHLLEYMFMQLGNDPQKPLEESLPLYDLHARSLLDLGKNTEAVELLQHVVQIRETKLAEDNSDRLTSQHELARAYQSNGQVQEAVELLQHVVQIEETKLAEDHPDRLASQHELAAAYHANGQVQKAVKLLQHVVQIQETKLAEDHSDRLASQHVLGSAYRANGQVQEAVELLQHVVQIQETTLAEDHPDRLTSQHELAAAYHANGQIQKAVELLQHVVQIKQAKFGKDHSSRVVSEKTLAFYLQRQQS